MRYFFSDEEFHFTDNFNLLQTTTKRIVYLATDDSSVWRKEVPKFEKKGYKFIGDSEICMLFFLFVF